MEIPVNNENTNEKYKAIENTTNIPLKRFIQNPPNLS
jgi:hypothetical protein